PKVRIEMVTPDDLVEGVLQILVEVGHTGQVGDGIVWVTPAERMIRLSEKITVLDC
ncbi:MAG: P-II family nitrogen regulator, partial [Methylophilaceae bacterium]